MNGQVTSSPQDERPTNRQNPTGWVSHPIDIRISVPFLRTRFYFTIVAGRERRPSQRRKAERLNFPIVTVGNTLFAFGVTTMITLAALAALVARSAILE